jgi:hypothetical protein
MTPVATPLVSSALTPPVSMDSVSEMFADADDDMPVSPFDAFDAPISTTSATPMSSPFATPVSAPFATPFVSTAGVPPYVPPAAPVAASAADLESEVEPAVATPVASPAPIEEWPLEEAAASLDEIARALRDGEVREDAEPARLFSNVATPLPLPAWSDDDLMNIMPTRVATPARTVAVEPVDAAVSAAAASEASAQAAAQALELLAQRVRAGELQLPGYDPRMGDAAALVSALAALLGLRLG